MTTDYYGNREEMSGYPLAAWLWGHRLREGQHWMEYLLEFLNVLVGFNYELGQGTGDTDPSRYNRFTRLGLRRFVFYDEREKNRNPLDDRARQLLLGELEKKAVKIANDDPITLSRQLLRSYSAIEEKRSWYAKSLFPAHQNLLFWEALRKRTGARGRGTKNQQVQDVESLQAQDLDKGVTFTDRNFFARGGEVYYLMLSAGTESNPARRIRITNNLKSLLTERNQEIGELAALIDDSWSDLQQNGPNDATDSAEARVGWIPARECCFYQIVAEDVDNLLQMKLDPLETLDLLAHLICFHIIGYIYHRACVGADSAVCATGNCLDEQPCLLIDCLEGRDSGVIRQFSAILYKEQEQQQIRAARNYVSAQVQAWAARIHSVNLDSKLMEDAEKYFDLSGLRRKTIEEYEQQVAELTKKLRKGKLERQEYLRNYAELLTSLLLDGFNKHFIGVHRKLARSIGLVAPRQGRHQRFVLEDTLLKALVLANVAPGDEMPYDEFLNRLHTRYGIVISQPQVGFAGLNERQSINANYYESNRAALLNKMKNAGLLREYSDATSIVRAINA